MTESETENFSSNLHLPSSSICVPSAQRPIWPQGNPPPLNLFSKLVNDLLIEILIRLPNPRSSCRCKAVCKLWRSLITDPSFSLRFISHHRSRYQPAAVFLPSHKPHSILSFLPMPDEARPDLRAFDCFKDLLLCGFADLFGELGRSYLVCNPFTKQWVALPLAPRKPKGGHYGSAVVLVCQPRTSTSISISKENRVQQPEPEPGPAFVYSEYRFRVVCLFQCSDYMMLHVFCSESRKWTKFFFKDSVKRGWTNVVWWNGRLFLVHLQFTTFCSRLAAYDPFHLDMPAYFLRVPPELWSAMRKAGNFSVSRGAFHIVVLEVESASEFSRNALTVWRLDINTGNWSQQYELVLKTTTTTSSSLLWGDFELEKCRVLDLHPEKPEIVFFKYLNECVFSCNLRTGTGEPEFFAAVELKCYEPGWRALQPRVSCWPTPIPRYEDLRGMYDGSYDCWVQNSSSTTTLSSTIEECQPLVEQFGRKRKDNRSAAAALHSKCCVRRKQEVVKGGL